ncbi:SDR family oxidoreductase [uncultured Cytophaga sp.]|uniref:SDR family oxidoreductase n=1 Tax=uncultured Cytophaga sp. TaxID=160238 RepID=UPI002635EF09|nr:SDR family oxidoreductase [uncultured Cytophaga sp.]
MIKRIAIITGGSSGIGEAIAYTLSENGYKVYATSRNPKKEKENDAFIFLKMDVRDDASVKDAIKKVIEDEGRIDVLINCAGLGLNGPIEETPIEMIKDVFETNFFGIVRTTQSVLPHMREVKTGFIINISSFAGEFGLPLRGYYSASKAAVEMFTEALRMEVKNFNVRVSIVQPGDFATNISANRPTATLTADSAYKDIFDKINDQVNSEMIEAADPSVLGEEILKILNKKSPQVRYRIGPFIQKLSVQVKKIVSGKIFETIIMNHYNIR